MASLFTDLWEPVNLGCRCVIVNTDTGYEPSIDDLVTHVVDLFGPHLKKLR